MNELWQLQKNIYKKLSSDYELASIITGVYNHLPQQTKFPYVHIGKIYASNYGSKTTKAMNVIIDINIYSRAQGNKEVLEVMSIVERILTASDNGRELDFIACELAQQSDGITYHLNSKFKAYIEEK
jgi:hypothetical protein